MARYSPPSLRCFFRCAASSTSRAVGSGTGKKNLVFLGSPQVLLHLQNHSFSVRTKVWWCLLNSDRTSGRRLGPGQAAGRVRLPGIRISGGCRRDAAAGRQEQGEEVDAVGRRAVSARSRVPRGTHLHARTSPRSTFLTTIMESLLMLDLGSTDFWSNAGVVPVGLEGSGTGCLHNCCLREHSAPEIS
jgi:hypothetical protein